MLDLQARLAAAVWSIAAVVFAVAFFAGGGSTEFGADRGRHLLSALTVALAYGGYWVMVWITRRRAGGVRAVDERDVHVVARAGQTTLIVVLVSVYVVAILAFLAYAISTIVVDRWTRGNG